MADMKPWHGLPRNPDTHCFDDDTQSDCWSYSPELVRKMLDQARREEREAVIAKLLELGALGEGTYIQAIRARSEA